jgi:hypothetical protein
VLGLGQLFGRAALAPEMVEHLVARHAEHEAPELFVVFR